jgi:endo-1,4-beta-xylanase
MAGNMASTGTVAAASCAARAGHPAVNGTLSLVFHSHKSSSWLSSPNRTIQFTGSYDAKGPGYLAIYGWTKNPLIEYYIVENYDILAPGEPWTFKGNFSAGCEGDYSVYTSWRVNKPSIIGDTTFQQFWSVRTEKRTGGTITTGLHYDAWRNFGMQLGYHDYMIVAVEGFVNGSLYSSGSANINVYN